MIPGLLLLLLASLGDSLGFAHIFFVKGGHIIADDFVLCLVGFVGGGTATIFAALLLNKAGVYDESVFFSVWVIPTTLLIPFFSGRLFTLPFVVQVLYYVGVGCIVTATIILVLTKKAGG